MNTIKSLMISLFVVFLFVNELTAQIITIKVFDDKKEFEHQVDDSWTVEQLRVELAKKSHVYVSQYVIGKDRWDAGNGFMDHDILTDSTKTLKEYGITTGTTIKRKTYLGYDYIVVRFPNNTLIRIPVESDEEDEDGNAGIPLRDVKDQIRLAIQYDLTSLKGIDLNAVYTRNGTKVDLTDPQVLKKKLDKDFKLKTYIAGCDDDTPKYAFLNLNEPFPGDYDVKKQQRKIRDFMNLPYPPQMLMSIAADNVATGGTDEALQAIELLYAFLNVSQEDLPFPLNDDSAFKNQRKKAINYIAYFVQRKIPADKLNEAVVQFISNANLTAKRDSASESDKDMLKTFFSALNASYQKAETRAPEVIQFIEKLRPLPTFSVKDPQLLVNDDSSRDVGHEDVPPHNGNNDLSQPEKAWNFTPAQKGIGIAVIAAASLIALFKGKRILRKIGLMKEPVSKQEIELVKERLKLTSESDKNSALFKLEILEPFTAEQREYLKEVFPQLN